ncbi:MAG: ankyrin repeat domain-containing protein [Pseudomonadota bacterium]
MSKETATPNKTVTIQKKSIFDKQPWEIEVDERIESLTKELEKAYSEGGLDGAFKFLQSIEDEYFREVLTSTALNKEGHTILHRAAIENNSEMVNQLIASGANPYMEAVNGDTPLNCAVDNKNIKIALLLVPNMKEGVIPNYCKRAIMEYAQEKIKEYNKFTEDNQHISNAGTVSIRIPGNTPNDNRNNSIIR